MIKTHVDIEYGYEEFIWDAPFDSIEEMVKWWESMERLSTFHKLMLSTPHRQLYTHYMPMPDDFTNWEEHAQAIAEWEAMENADHEESLACSVYIHAHTNSDSCLSVGNRVKGEVHRHKGFTEAWDDDDNYDYVYSHQYGGK